MKKFLISLLISLLTFGLFIWFFSIELVESQVDYKVAMITDLADVNDESFNQAIYSGCRGWCIEHDVPFNYYKPTDDSDFERSKCLELAIDRGYNVIFTPGYTFGPILRETAPLNKDIRFISIDTLEEDFLKEGETSYTLPDNVVSICFHEELSGYMAGYAAVKEGFDNLGFLGGIAITSVKRFGFGYIHGADDAAKELDKKVEVKVGYAGQFYGDNEITKRTDDWYKSGTDVVFACGGGVYTSVALAAKDNNKCMIGVDTDQGPMINRQYGDGVCITSALKGIKEAVVTELERVVIRGEFISEYRLLGLNSTTNPDENYVKLATGENSWLLKNFSIDDYNVLVSELISGARVVSRDVNSDTVPETSEHCKATYCGYFK